MLNVDWDGRSLARLVTARRSHSPPRRFAYEDQLTPIRLGITYFREHARAYYVTPAQDKATVKQKDFNAGCLATRPDGQV